MNERRMPTEGKRKTIQGLDRVEELEGALATVRMMVEHGDAAQAIRRIDSALHEPMADAQDGSDTETDANAKLIVAGPELLTRLETIADTLQVCDSMDQGQTRRSVRHMLKRVRAAIAKATA